MKAEFSFKTAVCPDYESLLIACQKTRETWRKRREEITGLRSSTRKATDELLRLQADYAKAYSRLEKHHDECELCRFVSELGNRNSENISMLH